MPQKITISYKIVFLTILSILAVILAYQIRSVLVTCFIAFTINAALRPVISFFERRLHARRGIAILLAYSILIVAVGLILAIIVGAALEQVSNFVANLTERINEILALINQIPLLGKIITGAAIVKFIGDFNLLTVNPEQILQSILTAVNVVGFPGINLIGSVLAFIISALFTLTISVYMAGNRDGFYVGGLALLPKVYSERVAPVMTRIQNNLGSWLLGELTTMAFMGTAAFLIIQIPRFFDPNYTTYEFALIIGLMSALFELIPNIGATLMIIVALVIAFLTGASLPVMIFILLGFGLIQQFEGLYLVPRIMKKAVEIHPVLTLAGVLAGFELGGPMAAFLAVPIIGIFLIIFKEVSIEWKKGFGEKPVQVAEIQTETKSKSKEKTKKSKKK